MTLYRAGLPLRWASATDRVTSAPPSVGALYYYNPAHSAKPNAKMAPTLAPPYQPRPEWILIEEFAPEPSYLARALELSGAQRFLPASIWQKLRHRNEPSYLYRVTA